MGPSRPWTQVGASYRRAVRAGELNGPTTGPVDTDELASPGPNVVFTDPVDSVQAEVDRLTGEGINKIVVL